MPLRYLPPNCLLTLRLGSRNMINEFRKQQFDLYNKNRSLLIKHPEILIDLEKFLMDYLYQALDVHKFEIKRDYNEASYLHPFWQNYPPEDRGRSPIKDQYPWIEVGEHAIGTKLARVFSKDFLVRDTGFPTGADKRFILSSEQISKVTNGLTDTAWLFIDIKSIGPRDDQDHTVMSHNQVSGDGNWDDLNTGVKNSVLQASGKHTAHDFHCSLPPLFILSDGAVAPLVIIALKPVYSMRPNTTGMRNSGQPLVRIDLACIPNGLLLTQNPAYLKSSPGLLFPGKDDKSKDPRKLRARVSFQLLRKIADWRVKTLEINYP